MTELTTTTLTALELETMYDQLGILVSAKNASSGTDWHVLSAARQIVHGEMLRTLYPDLRPEHTGVSA